MSMGGARREIRRLRDALRMDDQTFKAGAPPVDEFGMPDWTGDSLTRDVYERACGDLPDEELTDAELEVRRRLAPYAEVFARLERDATEEEGEPVT